MKILEKIAGLLAEILINLGMRIGNRTILQDLAGMASRILSVGSAVTVADEHMRIIYCDEKTQEMFGCTQEVIGMTVEEVHQLYKINALRFQEAIKHVQSKGCETRRKWEFKKNITNKAGETIYLAFELSGIWGYNKKIIGYILIARDITEQEIVRRVDIAFLDFANFAHKVRDLEQVCKMLHKKMGELIWAAIKNFSIILYHEDVGEVELFYNCEDGKISTRIRRKIDQNSCMGLSELLILGLISEGTIDEKAFGALVNDGMAQCYGPDIGKWYGWRITTANGEVLGVLRIEGKDLIINEHHQRFIAQVTQTLAHIIEGIGYAKKLEEQALFDDLTKLYNLRGFNIIFEQALHEAKRFKETLALLCLDLDGFKQINDTLGHDVGDMLLREVAKRLLTCVREVDRVSRVGGDEFAIILSYIEGIDGTVMVAERIVEQIYAPFVLTIKGIKQEIKIGVSIGMEMYYPKEGDEETTAEKIKWLRKNADMASYKAKETKNDPNNPHNPDQPRFVFYGEGTFSPGAYAEDVTKDGLEDDIEIIF